MRNLGLVPLMEGVWRLDEEDPSPGGKEFEEFTERLEAFLEGYFYSKGIFELPLYVRGDFFDERTEVVYLTEEIQGKESLISALRLWLKAPRHRNWRIAVSSDTSDEAPIVIYPDAIIGRN